MLRRIALWTSFLFLPSLASAQTDTRNVEERIVALEVAPALSEPNLAAMLTSCSSVFGEPETTGCALFDSSSSGRHRATVSWKPNPSGLQVTIEIGGDSTSQRVIRVLSFHESSTDEERWQAVGLVVAALASAEMSKVRPAVNPEVPEPAELPVIPPPKKVSQLVLDLGGILRKEAAKNFLTGGGIMRASLDLGGTVQPTVALGIMAGTNPVNQLSLRPSLGLFVELVQSPLEVLLRAEAFALATRWSASDPLGSESTWHVRYGASLGPTVRVPVASSLGIFLDAAGSAAFPPIEVRVRAKPFGATSVLGGEGAVGIWARF